MRFTALVALFGALLAAAGTARAEGEKEKPRCAVIDLRAAGVDPTLAENVSAVLVAELHASGAFGSVIAKSDISSMLSLEQQKQVLGCDTDSSSCLAEIGGALGVQRVVAGSVGKVGTAFLLNLQLIEAGKAKVLERAYRRVDGDEAAVLSAVPDAVAELLHLPRKPPPASNAVRAEAPRAPARANTAGLALWSFPIVLAFGAGAGFEHAVSPGLSVLGSASGMRIFDKAQTDRCVQVADPLCSWGVHANAGVAWYVGGGTAEGLLLGLRLDLLVMNETHEQTPGTRLAKINWNAGFDGRLGYKWVDAGGFTLNASAGIAGVWDLNPDPCTTQQCDDPSRVTVIPILGVEAGYSF